MISRLRAFMDRPLRESDRSRLFALAVASLLAGAALLALIDGPGATPDRKPARATPERVPAPALPDELAAVTASAAEPPSEEGEPPAASAASRAQIAGAERAARRFLTGYLPYSYGQRSARQIPAATTRLRARLARERPRVPAGVRRRHPRVVLLHAHGVAPRNGELVALVSDGTRRYSVLLELERAPAGWRVTDVGS